MAQDDNPKNIVQSVAKVFAVLRAFDTSLPELTISDVAARAGMDRGPARRGGTPGIRAGARPGD